jgi:hypothetical protein
VPEHLTTDIRDYEIQRKDFTVTGTLDRRNGRWAWSPTLKLQVGDVVVVRPR